ncbi:MAG: hypothetical protein IPF77_16685 [Gemmatimonadetes bacterium]|nr:hypothetical protein [Gemmatimonadota bacterium]
MGRFLFVGWLFVMALACLVVAVAERSWGWLAGALVLGPVAWVQPHAAAPGVRARLEQPSGRFLLIAFGAMLAIAGLIFAL